MSNHRARRSWLRFLSAIPALLTAASAGAQQPTALAGARAFRVPVVSLPADAPGDPLDPSATAWEKVQATRVILSRTPRIFQTEPSPNATPPAAEVRVLKRGGTLLVKLEWDDATENAPVAPEAQKGTAGVPELIYKRPTTETASFSDAAAVMIPENWQGPAFPSLIMGDEKSPALLYHWSAARGASVLRAQGRATSTPIDKAPRARASRDKGRWRLVFDLPAPAIEAGYPVAFAVWDGAHADRDGQKFFSTWYVLAPAPAAPAPGTATP